MAGDPESKTPSVSDPGNTSREVRRLRALADGAFEGLAIHQDGIILHANEALARMARCTVKEMVGKPVLEYAALESRTTIASNVQNGVADAYEVVALRADGTTFPAELQGKTITIDGEVLRVTAIRDLSERKQMETELAKSHADYQMLFEKAADGIGIARTDGTILSYNDGVASLLGYTREELIGKNIRSVVSPENQREAPIRFRELQDRQVKGERSLLRKDGSVVQVELTNAPLGDGRIFTIFHDVTERNQLREQLLQSQKLESVGRLAGGIAHDFNNLLTVVMGNADLLRRRLTNHDPTLASMAEDIAQAAERGSDLTSQLLTFSRRQLVERSALSLNEVVREALRMMRRLIGEDIDVTLDLDANLPAILANRAQMLQVMMNLVINARDAMPKGGRVTLQTGIPEKGTVTLTVSDTGIGMSRETVRRAFEPFFTTKPLGEGSGLGLSTVYGIVTQGGGRIDIDSELGKGSKVTLFFPAFEIGQQASPPDHKAQMDDVPNAIVMLVEDEPAVADVTRRILQTHGYTVHFAPSPKEALSLVGVLGDFDLLITDVVMPGQNGYDLAREIRQKRPKLKVLYASGYAEDRQPRCPPDTTSPALTQHFIAKPFNAAALLDKVRQILRA